MSHGTSPALVGEREGPKPENQLALLCTMLFSLIAAACMGNVEVKLPTGVKERRMLMNLNLLIQSCWCWALGAPTDRVQAGEQEHYCSPSREWNIRSPLSHTNATQEGSWNSLPASARQGWEGSPWLSSAGGLEHHCLILLVGSMGWEMSTLPGPAKNIVEWGVIFFHWYLGGGKWILPERFLLWGHPFSSPEGTGFPYHLCLLAIQVGGFHDVWEVIGNPGKPQPCGPSGLKVLRQSIFFLLPFKFFLCSFFIWCLDLFSCKREDLEVMRLFHLGCNWMYQLCSNVS